MLASAQGLTATWQHLVTVVGHTGQALITDQISFGVTLIPITWEQEKGRGQEPSLLHRKARSPGVKFEIREVSTSSFVKWIGTSTSCLGSLSGPASVLSSLQNSFAPHGKGPQRVCHVKLARCISRPVTVHAQVCASVKYVHHDTWIYVRMCVPCPHAYVSVWEYSYPYL